MENSIRFREIDNNQMDVYRHFLSLCMQIPSPMTPYTILGYKESEKIRCAFAHDMYWFQSSIDGENCWLMPVGDWDQADWKKIFTCIPAGTHFKYIPKLLLKQWQKAFGASITAVSNRDDWDYVWYIDRMVTAQGKKYKSMRQNYRYFSEHYVSTLESITPEKFDEISQFHENAVKEIKQRTNKAEDLMKESMEFYSLLKNWNDAYLYGYILRVEGNIACVWINEVIDENNIIGTYQKQNYEYKGVTDFVYLTDAKIAESKGFMIMNVMSDAGAEGLRRHKLLTNPLVLMELFDVSFHG